MTTTFTEKFFRWADAHQVSREDIATETGNSKQTISNWKSNGIPKGKEFGLRSFMERQLRSDTESIRHKMVLEPSREQFNRWNKASMQAGKTMEDWAFDSLEEMAANYYLQVAEDKGRYNQKTNAEDKPA